MPFLERLQSAMILKTPMYQHHEAHIVEYLHTPFYEAILKNDIDTVAKMIEDGFDVDFYGAAHIAPLIYCIIHKKIDIALFLIQHGADVNICTSEGESALHVSTKLQYTQMTKLLLEYKADMNFTPDESCFESAKKGNLLNLSLTCNSNKSLVFSTNDGYNLLHFATYARDIDTIVYLLNKTVNIDSVDNNNNTALNIAAKLKNSIKIVELLIKRGASLEHKNSQLQTPLNIALQYANTDVAKLLIHSGANIHIASNLHTPLTLTHNGIFNYPEKADEFRAIERELLIKGANVDIPTNALRWTPLFTTVSKMQTHVLKLHFELLIKLGADINYLDTNKRSVLMIASSLGRYEAIEILLQNYAQIDLLDKFGWSALMFGVYYNHYNIVELLLNNGADVNLSSHQKLSAIKIAKEHKREKMIALLLDFLHNSQ